MTTMTPPRRHPGIVTLPPQPHEAIVKEYALEGGFVGASEADSPWVPFGESAAIRHLAFDVRQGMAANILWVKGGGRIGTHRHRGHVSAVTLEGSWGYYEYDWIATPGSFVHETPGTHHTLYSDDPNGMKAMFWLNGPIEFFDDQGTYLETVDVFWFINHYVTHCREHGLPINQALFI